MIFSDIELSKRLERVEGRACTQFAEARRKLFPESGAEWIECAGAYAVFDGVDSPLTQTFGLGLFEELSPDALAKIEQFYKDRNAPVMHEVSPFVGSSALALLCQRNYRPVELSSVLYCPVEKPDFELSNDIRVRLISKNETSLWAETNTKGWTHEHPELQEFLRQIGAIASARQQSLCFLAEFAGTAAAAGMLFLHEGVALFAGSATIPEMRRRGLQTALLHERMRYAFNQGCNLAAVVAEPGSNSQRNAERRGFRIAYTRTKWGLQA